MAFGLVDGRGNKAEGILSATKACMDAFLRGFGSKADRADVAIIFYAGHGIQVNGDNYLIPIGANPQSVRDLKRDLVKLDDVFDDMGSAKVKEVFFDACRDNPLARSFSRGGRGMAAPVETTGTLISFATKHGNTASDGAGRHTHHRFGAMAAVSVLRGPINSCVLASLLLGDYKGAESLWSLDMSTSTDNARRTGPALEAMHQFILWLIPAVEKFPRSQKFLLGDRFRGTALDVLDRLIGPAKRVRAAFPTLHIG